MNKYRKDNKYRKEDLHTYQRQVIDRIKEQKKIACFLDCGLGKTIITLTSIEELGKPKTLIIAPKNIAENVWLQETKKWEHTSDLRVQLVMGSPDNRLKALRSEADIYVISRDNTAWLFQQEWFKATMLVIDESTSFKDRSTKRWASLMQKSITCDGHKCYRKEPMIKQYERIVLLTGTPASESYAGLWAQIALITGDNNPLGKTIGLFRAAYMIPQNFGGFPVYTKMRPGAIEEINHKLDGLCISMESIDHLDMPEKISIIRQTGMNDSRYWQMEKDGVITVDGTDIIAGDPLTRYTKMQQIASGFIYDDHGRVHKLNTAKQDAMAEMIEATDETMLIIYKYDFEKEILQKMGGEPLDTKEAIARWQQGKIRIGLLYPACAYGLNIQSTCSLMVWYTPTWSLEQHEQAVKRLWRQGQRQTVRIYYLIGKGTIDEYVYNLLAQKKNVLDGLMEYFKF